MKVVSIASVCILITSFQNNMKFSQILILLKEYGNWHVFAPQNMQHLQHLNNKLPGQKKLRM